MDNKSEGRQLFTCYGRENVTLHFCGDRQPRLNSKPGYELNSTWSKEYPYMATFEVSPMEMSSHSVITCLSANTGKILHTWELSSYRKL